jgi:hypothetical protein
MPAVDFDVFARTTRHLLRMLIEARRDIEILNRLVALSVPLPLATFDAIRREVITEIAPSMRAVEETPDDKLLEFLHNFQGTVQ